MNKNKKKQSSLLTGSKYNMSQHLFSYFQMFQCIASQMLWNFLSNLKLGSILLVANLKHPLILSFTRKNEFVIYTFVIGREIVIIGWVTWQFQHFICLVSTLNCFAYVTAVLITRAQTDPTKTLLSLGLLQGCIFFLTF